LSWFGPDVTSDAAYQNRAIALNGAPQVPEVQLTNAALNSLLDTLENRHGTGRSYVSHARNAEVEIVQSAAPAAASERGAPAAQGRSSAQAVQVSTDVEIAEDENNDLNLSIEDNVIRELARSLRPQRR